MRNKQPLQPDAIIPHLDMTMLAARTLARENSMYLISDGFRIVIAPYIPPGWREVPIRIKQPKEGLPCIA